MRDGGYALVHLKSDFSFRESKVKRIHSAMAEKKADALILGNWDNIRYATGFRWMPLIMSKTDFVFFVAVVPQDKDPILIVPRGDYSSARQDYGLSDVRIAELGPTGLSSSIEKVMQDYHLVGASIGIDNDFFPATFYDQIVARLPSAYIGPAKEVLQEARMIKLPVEIERIRRANQITEECIQRMFEKASPGVSEAELAAEGHYNALRQGAEAVESLIVASGVNTGRIHYQRFATEKRLERGDSLMIDMNAVVDGYCSDITRTTFVGKPDPKMVEIYRTVFEASRRMKMAVRAGTEVCHIDEAARDFVNSMGYRENYDVTVYPGHGIGLSAIEEPHISNREGFRTYTKARAGMVLALEPGVYLDSWGVRIEDVVLVTDDGFEALSSDPPEM